MIFRRTCRTPPLRALSLALSLCMAGSAHAAGYYAFEIGPKAVGRAGAVVVNPGDPTALWLNPAAITNVSGLQLRLDGAGVFLDGSFVRDCGPRDDCGPRPLLRNYGDGRAYRVDANRAPADDENVFEPRAGNLGRFRTPSDFSDGHAVRNQAPMQAIPGIWGVLNGDTFGIDGVALGFGLYAPYAGDYEFPADEFTRYSLINRDILELYYQATLAYRFRNWIAIGASLQGVSAGVRQRVKLSADRFGGENPDADLLIELDTLQHFVPSANFGLWSSPLPGLELGASLQLGRSVRATGPLRILERGPEIEELSDAGLVTFEEDNPTATVSFDMPAYWRAGVKYGQQGLFDGLLGFDVEADFVYEQWSSYDHVFLETKGVSFAFGQGADPVPLEPIIQPRDWQDAWSVRLGGEVNFFEQMIALRSGVMYETAAVPTSSLNVELLNGEKLGVGIGGSVKVFGVTLDVGYGHHFVFDRVVGDESILYVENPVRTFNPEPRTRIAMGRYSMSYNVLSVGLNVAFDEMFAFGVHKERPRQAPAPAPESAPESAPEPAAPEEAPAVLEEAPEGARG